MSNNKELIFPNGLILSSAINMGHLSKKRRQRYTSERQEKQCDTSENSKARKIRKTKNPYF